MTRLAVTLALVLAACSGDDAGPADPDVEVVATAEDAPDAAAPDADADTAPAEEDVAADVASDAQGDADAGPLGCPGAEGEAPELRVRPYLQSADPHGVWILWETAGGVESRVDWGPTEALGEVACGGTEPLDDFLDLQVESTVHSVRIDGLQPETTYFYRVRTGVTQSEVHRFVTPPAKDSEASFRLVAMSDSQRDDDRPLKLREVVEEGILAFVESEYGGHVSEALGPVLLAGDLVDNGWEYEEWHGEFFAQAGPLLSSVPFYPVPGNHEGNSPHFWRYFKLPDNGSPDFEEHWYRFDWSNVRVIGLDSAPLYRNLVQLDWLEAALEDACADDTVDFVFAQLHHPHHSELWPHGNTDWTGDVIRKLEDFSTACGKPSVHFFGHTHGYARGASRDHAHMMVNVASAGGRIDRWGDPEQIDYPEYSVSQDEWGFVVMEVEAGDAPAFRLRRVSRGNEDEARDNEVRDEVLVRRYDEPPAQPEAVETAADDACGGGVVLRASAFSDPDGDDHAAAHWQAAPTCDDFSEPAVDRWRQHENWFRGEDTRAGDDLTDEVVVDLEPGAWCWRVRYRGTALAWSPWSEPEAFQMPACE
ncbi:MAG: metallophosphoesterase [Myxococcota bacterium]